MTETRGSRFVTELLRYKCPFTERKLELHPTHWPRYLKRICKNQNLEDLVEVYLETKDQVVKDVVESEIMYHHNSVVQ